MGNLKFFKDIEFLFLEGEREKKSVIFVEESMINGSHISIPITV